MTLAYVAGVFDGEGCVGFARARRAVFPRVLVTNTNRELLEDLRARFGGDISPLSQRREGWKQGWSWRLSWTSAVVFLEAIVPWLRVKQQQAQTVFAWDAIRLGRGWWRDTREHEDAVALLVERMHWLNAKGPLSGADPIDAIALNTARRSGRKK